MLIVCLQYIIISFLIIVIAVDRIDYFPTAYIDFYIITMISKGL